MLSFRPNNTSSNTFKKSSVQFRGGFSYLRELQMKLQDLVSCGDTVITASECGGGMT